MTHTFRNLARPALLAGAACLAAPVAQAQDRTWPTGDQVTIIVPFSPGGIADVPGRILAEHLSEQTGATFILEHRPGAGGTVGTAAMLQAEPDGNTLLIVSSGAAIAPSIYPDAPDPRTGLTPISILIDIPISIMVLEDSEITDLDHLIEASLAEPGRFSFGTGGVGSGNHLAGEMFSDAAGIEMLHVPYGGAAAATTGLLSRETDLSFASIFEARAQASAGTARILGVGSAERLAEFPDVPAINEYFEGFLASNYFSLVAHPDLDPAMLEAIVAELDTLAANPEAQATAERADLPLVLTGPDALMERYESDVPQFAEIIERLDL